MLPMLRLIKPVKSGAIGDEQLDDLVISEPKGGEKIPQARAPLSQHGIVVNPEPVSCVYGPIDTKCSDAMSDIRGYR